MNVRIPPLLLALALLGVGAPLAAQTIPTASLTQVRWRELGPARGGRSVAVAGSTSRTNEYWMGTTGGGVWKTVDGGVTWQPMTDRYFGGTIGAIGVAESNPDIVYVGGGETDIRGNTSHGDGLWKTTDAGRTWTLMGLKETRHIGRVRVHPTNADIVYVAALGHAFGNNPERGVFKTTDGGKTWAKVLYRNDSTGVWDLILDPSDPNTLYATFWHAYRRPWMLNSGGPGSGIMKSTDGGTTWREITSNPGLPKGLLGKIGLAISPANPKRIWAQIEADAGGTYRSDDAGATWQYLNGDRNLRQRAWYYSRLVADPKDTNVVYGLNVSFFRSTDGGKSWRQQISVPHGDNHDLWIAPNDPMRMVQANDGGANVSFNGGQTWTEQDFATAQFYHVSTTNHFPYKVCGAQQDNSTLCGPSRQAGGIRLGDWDDAGGGESGYVTADPKNPDIVYAGSYSGYLTRKDMRTGLERNINAWPDNPMGWSSEDIKYKFQWTFPIVISMH
ncbi:MAG: WD40/YVTN/BNR-like repeat-containing protein, partial [Gemmatimonadaceae bacterium]